jgi:hypothetical protein
MNVVVTITPSAAIFPAGTAIATYRVGLVDAAGTDVQPPQDYPSVPASVTFASVAPGAGYRVQGKNLSPMGTLVGTVVESAPFDVAADVILTVFGGITVRVVPVG